MTDTTDTHETTTDATVNTALIPLPPPAPPAPPPTAAPATPTPASPPSPCSPALPQPLPTLPAWQQRAIITVALAIGLGIFTYGIDTGYGELFTGFLIVVGFGAWALHTAGILERFSALSATNRGFSIVMAFAA